MIYHGEVDHKTERPHGQGVMVDANGNLYEGSFQNGKYHGLGRMVKELGTYRGGWEDGVRSGYGEYIDIDGEEWEGEW